MISDTQMVFRHWVFYKEQNSKPPRSQPAVQLSKEIQALSVGLELDHSVVDYKLLISFAPV